MNLVHRKATVSKPDSFASTLTGFLVLVGGKKPLAANTGIIFRLKSIEHGYTLNKNPEYAYINMSNKINRDKQCQIKATLHAIRATKSLTCCNGRHVY